MRSSVQEEPPFEQLRQHETEGNVLRGQNPPGAVAEAREAAALAARVEVAQRAASCSSADFQLVGVQMQQPERHQRQVSFSSAAVRPEAHPVRGSGSGGVGSGDSQAEAGSFAHAAAAVAAGAVRQDSVVQAGKQLSSDYKNEGVVATAPAHSGKGSVTDSQQANELESASSNRALLKLPTA